jgi:outer membrane protein assembly factor BamB
LLVCWGARGSSGGVTAFSTNRLEEKWTVDTSSGIEGGVVLAADRVLFGSTGSFGQGELVCASLDDGRVLWREPITDGIWGAPVVADEVRVFCAGGRGEIHCLDIRTGKELQGWPARITQKRAWLLLNGGRLYAATEAGEIFFIDPHRGVALGSRPISIGARIRSEPVIYRGKLYLGTMDGRVLALDPNTRLVATLAEGLGRVTATPEVDESGRLYVGTVDSDAPCVQAIDLKSQQPLWQVRTSRSVSAKVLARDGMVFAASHDGIVSAIWEEHIIWQFPTPGRRKLMSRPAAAGEYVFVAATDGAVYALPWHLGRWGWAADYLKQRGRYTEAAEYYFLAAINRDGPEKLEMLQKAEQAWMQARRPELAARMWEGIAHEEEAAAAYCRAAENWRGRSRLQAAKYYYGAHRMYWRLNHEDPRSEEALVQAIQLGRWPRLRLRERNNPKLPLGEPRSITIRLENTGYRSAQNIRFFLGGSLLQAVEGHLKADLSRDSYFNLTLEIMPTREQERLCIEVHYGADGAANGFPLQVEECFQIESSPAPHKIRLRDQVKGKFRITNPNNEPLDIEMDGGMWNEVDIAVGPEPHNGEGGAHGLPSCPNCGGFNDPDAKICNHCGREIEGP